MAWNKVILTLLTYCMMAFTFASEQIYSIADLRALEEQNGHAELLDHAFDVLPAKRDVIWNNLVENAGLAYIKKLSANNKSFKEDFLRLKRISKWPLFNRNEFYISYQDKFFLAKIKNCMESQEMTCLAMAKSFLADFKHENSFNFELAMALPPGSIYKSLKWDIIQDKLKNEISLFYCHKASIKEIIIENIANSEHNLSSKIHPKCIKNIQVDLNKVLLVSNYTMEQKMRISHVLLDFNLLETEASALINIENFLKHSDLDKEQLNRSLKEFAKISQNSDYRELILKRFKQFDPMPDDIFKNINKITLAKINIITKNFPELIDLYASTCLDYLTGAKQFKRGNPTPNCHQFFKMVDNREILPGAFVKNYKKATQFYTGE